MNYDDKILYPKNPLSLMIGKTNTDSINLKNSLLIHRSLMCYKNTSTYLTIYNSIRFNIYTNTITIESQDRNKGFFST